MLQKKNQLRKSQKIKILLKEIVKKLSKIYKQKIIHIGTFGAPLGLKGEIKIKVLTSNFKIFKSIGEYLSFDRLIKWKFKKIMIRSNKCVAHPLGCNSRNEAELLKNKKIYCYKNKLSKDHSKEYLVSDLLICKIFLNDGQFIGNVLNVENFGAGNLLETKYNNKNIYIPMNEENLISVNLNKKTIVVDPIKGILN